MTRIQFNRVRILGIFLDTSFFLGLCHPLDPNHKTSVRMFRAMAGGNYGLIFTSTFVIAETATLILIRTSNNNRIIDKFHEMFSGSTRVVRLLDVNVAILEDIWTLFQNHNKKAKTKKQYLSFVDASNVVLCRHNEIDKIASFDGDFDTYLQRID
ncbi:MAG: type II toxin-antitoxin system VapC family toxin [Candidatus Sigynarchaeota archaeon]